jgi:replicative DNA helicase
MEKKTNLGHGKLPPMAIDMEEAILGGIMIQSSLFLEVSEIIDATSFYKEQHQLIYETLNELNGESKSLDIITVCQRLKKKGILDRVGGPYYITTLTNRPANIMSIEDNAKVVQEKKIARDIIHLSSELITEAYDETCDILKLADKLVTKSYSIGEVQNGDKEMTNAELVAQVSREIELAKTHQGVTGIETGMKALDKVTLGYQDSDLIIKAGRPAMGKSAQALCEAVHMAVVEKKEVLFFSLEMSAPRLMRRAISVESGVQLNVIKAGYLSADQRDAYNAASSRIIESKLRIIDIGGLSLNALRRIVKKHKMKHGVDAVYIDYLQLMTNNIKGGNREQEISGISRGLKLLAKELNIPVIALAQLSRAVEQRGGSKKPMLSDLRESGSLEQDADMVQFLYRPEYYGITEDEDGDPTIGVAYVMIAKNREGDVIDVPLHFDPSCTKFSDIESDYNQPKVSPKEYNPNLGIEARVDFDTDKIDDSGEADVPF